MRNWIVVGTIALGLVGFGCSEEDSGPKGEWVAPATTVCEKVAQCSDTTLSSSQMNECLDLVKPAFTVLPDAAAFESCVVALECSTLENSASEALRGCMDLDTETFACDGDTTLHACTNSGVCKDIACSDACDLMDGTPAGCGLGNEGWDNCLCYQ